MRAPNVNMISTPLLRLGAGKRWGLALDLGVWFALILLTSLAARLLARAGAPRDILRFLSAPVFMLTLLAWATVSLHRHGETWRSLVLKRPISIVRTTILVVAGYFGAIALNALLILMVLPRLGVSRPSLTALSSLAHNPGVYVAWLALAWTSAAVGEELQFRGFLMSRLERLLGRGWWATGLALAGQATVFGALHIYQGPGGMLATGVLGLVFGAVFLFGRRNALPNIIVHGLVDTVSLTLIFLGYAT